MKQRTLAHFMVFVQKFILNCKNPEILNVLARFGVTEARIDEGITLYNDTQKSIDDQKREHQEKQEAYDEFFAKKGECLEEFKLFNTFGRLAVKGNKDMHIRIGFNQPKELSTFGWMKQAEERYKASLTEPDFITKMNRYNITTEDIEEYKTNIENLILLRAKYDREKGQAENSTNIKRDKVEELEDYIQELKTIAKFALKDSPQLLEELGIVVR
ncbi:MAG: hypothetical protein N4A72_09125 [Bacteroidales bacterium]|nr:hypothetical protein [Bacteroidales bacterium]